jgi:serine/threonine protein kinase/tetratricopeptide (TPR) repeat protein
VETPGSKHCLDEDTLVDLAVGDLEPRTLEEAEAHLTRCTRCSTRVAQVKSSLESETQPAPAGTPKSLAPGTLIDRFIVLREVGAGAMGAVYVAHDPKLDRKVALKVLKHELGEAPQAEHRRGRMQREAQALARLSHENLVGVFDVLNRGDEVVIAMEYVAGTSLAAWLAEPRPWREVVRVFLAAGRGLAAAHDAQLVHRDFKPANVLLSETGAIKVTDFGLATVGDAPRDGSTDFLESSVDAALKLDLTEAGSIVGTPSYMAPEALRGEPATPASDQFSFCVALYEALYRHRPYSASTLYLLWKTIIERKIRAEPSGSEVPSWLRALVLRGLSPEPKDRFRSMHELLASLGRDRRRERLRRVVVVAGVALGLSLVATLARRPPRPCDDEEVLLRDLWDEPQRASVRAAFLATGASGASASADEVDRALSAWLLAWRRDYQFQCSLNSEPSDLPLSAALTLQTNCMRRLLDEARSAVAAFASADRQLVDRASLATRALTPSNTCATVEPPAALGEHEAASTAPLLRLRMAGLRALSTARDAPQLTAEARELREAATGQGVWDVQAEASLVLASAGEAYGDLPSAEHSARSAVQAAVRSRDYDLLARSWAALAAVRSAQGASADATENAQLARVAASSVPRNPRLDAQVARALGATAMAAGRLAEAAEHEGAAARAAAAAFGPRSAEHGRALCRLAAALQGAGDLQRAIEALQSGLSLAGAELTNLEMGRARVLLAKTLVLRGEASGARQAAEVARADLAVAGAAGASVLREFDAWRATSRVLAEP